MDEGQKLLSSDLGCRNCLLLAFAASLDAEGTLLLPINGLVEAGSGPVIPSSPTDLTSLNR